MAQVVDEQERRARRRRLTIILIVAGVILGGLFAFGILRNHSINDNADSAIAALRSKWRPLDLSALADADAQATFKGDTTGDDSASEQLFPTASHADFSGAQFLEPGTVQANYSVPGWGGATQCLSLVAEGPTPNQVMITRGGAGC